MEPGLSLKLFAVSTMTTVSSRFMDHPYPIFPKSDPHLHPCYRVRVRPCAHPQHHVKVLKHFVYIQYGNGMESEAVYILNHDTPHSIIQVHPHPIFPNSGPFTCTSVTV